MWNIFRFIMLVTMTNKENAKPMKIVFIGTRDLNTIGGIESFTRNLSRELVRLKVSPVVYCESDHFGKTTLSGIEVISLKSLPSRFITKPILGIIATLHAVCFHHDAVLFHYNAWGPSLASWIPRLLGIATVMHGHGFEWQRTKYSPFQRKILKFMEMLTAKLNQNLLMCSQEQSDFFEAEYHRKAEVITGGVYLPSNRIADENFYLEKWELEANKFILFLGRLVQDKNPDVLIRAFRKMKNRNGLKLVIAGDNPQLPGYTRMLHETAGNEPDIVFTGSIYGDEKNSLLKNCFCFCLPSMIEGLPITLLEAMAFRVPCVVSDNPACREAIGDNGFYVLPGDEDFLCRTMDKLVLEKDLYEDYYENEFQIIKEKYTWEAISLGYYQYVCRLTNFYP